MEINYCFKFFGPRWTFKKTLLILLFLNQLHLKDITDVLPSNFIGGRGGVTKTGARVYSDTDSSGDKICKKFCAHILKGIEPGALTTGRKLVQGLQGDVKRGGQPVSLQDELLALLSGIRIINVDVPRTMQYKITEYNKIKDL